MEVLISKFFLLTTNLENVIIMIENRKAIIALLFVLGALIVPCLVFGQDVENYLPEPKTATVHAPIDINGNTALDTFFSGDGTDGLSWTTAHVMSNLEIDVTGTENCIRIRNTDRYLIIQDCTLSNASADWTIGGIYLSDCSNIRITGCTMVDCGSGVIARDGCSEILINDNDFNNNLVGILTQEAVNITISNNLVRNSDPYSGIEIYDTSDSRISGNTVTSNAAGIALMWNSDGNIVSGNTVQNNGAFGIYLDTDAGNNEVYNNCVENNTDANIQDEGQNNNIHDNNCPGIPGYLLLEIIGVLLGTITFITLTIRKRFK